MKVWWKHFHFNSKASLTSWLLQISLSLRCSSMSGARCFSHWQARFTTRLALASTWAWRKEHTGFTNMTAVWKHVSRCQRCHSALLPEASAGCCLRLVTGRLFSSSPASSPPFQSFSALSASTHPTPTPNTSHTKHQSVLTVDTWLLLWQLILLHISVLTSFPLKWWIWPPLQLYFMNTTCVHLFLHVSHLTLLCSGSEKQLH